MAKRRKIEHIDGLGPEDLKKIHKALGQVRRWSYPVRLVKKRCLHEDGFYRCENPACSKKGQPVPAIQVDHIEPIGEVGGPRYIERMFVPSTKLQGLCKTCHGAKTRAERKAAAKPKRERKIKDFF
jgi:5-methylcytosine-specific restriction endonuclease McrA